jgi:hypothetical protein
VLAPSLAPTPTTEWALLGASGLLAGWVLTRGIEKHGRPGILLLALAGVLLWAASLGGWFSPVPEELTTVVASLLVAGSLFVNLRWRRESATTNGCGCSACEAEGRPRPSSRRYVAHRTTR